MLNYLSENSDINLKQAQSGFRKFYCTCTTALMIDLNERKSLDNRKRSIMVLLVFSKALDSVDYAKLCLKLKQRFRSTSDASNLLYSYLTNR